MSGLSELVLRDNEAVEAVGWFDGPPTRRELHLSPSWRPERRVKVHGGSVKAFPPDDQPDAIATHADERVHVRGIWQRDVIHQAQIVAEPTLPARTDETDFEYKVSPATPQEHTALRAWLRSEDIAWYRILSRADGRRAIKIGVRRPEAIEPQLSELFTGTVELIKVSWSEADLAEVRHTLQQRLQDWHVTATGSTHDTSPNADFFGLAVEVLYVVPSMAQWVDALTPGLLTVKPLIRPARY